MTAKTQTHIPRSAQPHFAYPFLPEQWWWIAGGSLLFAAWLGLSAFLAHIDTQDANRVSLQFSMWSGAFWWLLMGTRFVALIYRMASLHLPGLQVLLRQGLCLHGMLAVGLPLLVMGLWPVSTTNTDLAALAAALWLGWSCGALLISLPAVAAVLPTVLLVFCADTVTTPWISATVGSLVLLCLHITWRWHLSSLRSPLAAPLGAWMEGTSMQWQLIGQLRDAAAGFHSRRLSRPLVNTDQGTVHRIPADSNDLLAALLGPNFQTLRQLWGHQGRRLTWFVCISVAMALLAIEHFWLHEEKVASGFMLYFVFSIVMPMQQPHLTLHAMHRTKPAQMAELYLTPGMPAREQLEKSLMRQTLYCLGERGLLSFLVGLAALNLSYPMNSTVLIWLACATLLGLGQGLYAAWLAWHGRRQHWLWLAIFFGAFIGTSNWLLLQQKTMVLALWLFWGTFLLATLVWLCKDWRSIYTHQPVPCK